MSELVKLPWMCLLCWQEGAVDVLDTTAALDISEIRAVSTQHDDKIARIIGGVQCAGSFRKKEARIPKRRVKREKAPELDLETGGGIEIH